MANFERSQDYQLPLSVPEDRASGLLSLAPSFPHRHSAPTILRSRLRYLRQMSSSASNASASLSGTKGALGLNLLHEPSEPRVDFIFVHGLQGGSRKTWSLSPEDPWTFWPKEWLPYESGFRHVRIHSFGYDSDWTKMQQSTLTIHDFAQALLADMHNSPYLKRNERTPIVFIAHSMGGLIVKKTYMLSTRDPLYEGIASRVHSFYFLGTPHKGSNSGLFLKVFLSMSLPSGPKSYVRELLPDSQTVQTINDEFRHITKDVHLWSFFEGAPTAGVMIVDKTSAIIGLPGEHIQYLQADHRHLCKFESSVDPNYIILLRCFITTIEEVERGYARRERDDYKAQMKLISNALGIERRPEQDLLINLGQQHKGSCEWLTTSEGFQTWLACDASHNNLDIETLDKTQTSQSPRFLWLNGPPGSGKSIASGHVVKYLDSINLDCSYFFFKNNAKATVTKLLLNLAYQMAESNYEVRHIFLALIHDGEEVNTQDHTVIWNNIFLGRLFKISFSQPQFWVIDALDECPSKSLTTLIQMLAKIDAAVLLRVFLSSRSNARVERLFNQEMIDRIEMHTGRQESMNDIAAFIRSKPKLLEGDDGDKMMSDILKKSNGIFLWASLTINRLDELYSVEDMRAALRQVPSEMNGFYTKILENITLSSNADLAKCILKWVICAPEPLTTEELKEAVRFDISRTLLTSTLNDIFSQVCSNLVTVDSESRVQLMHQTVKDFLIASDSGFYVNPRQAHERLAFICLTHLNRRNFYSGISRRSVASAGHAGDFAFDDYACSSFSYHLAHSHSTAAELFSLLATFFNCNVLTWIERIAKTGKLGAFITAIQSLKIYLPRQLERSAPFDTEYRSVSAWVNDLTHLVTIFGSNLIVSPSSIYALIPPLCPTSSIIHKSFARRSRHRVICCTNENWDERSSCLLFSSTAKSVASNDRYVAVGLVDGTIRVFDSSTREGITTLNHGEPVRQLAFGNISNILVSCSPKRLTLWGSQHTLIWSVSIVNVAFSVCFTSDDTKLFITVKGNVNHMILPFAAKDGVQLEPLSTIEDKSDSDSDDNSRSHERFIPDVVRLSPLLGFAAVAYRSSHLTLYSLDSEDCLEKICRFEKNGCEALSLPPQVLDVTFNPAVELDLMAVSYQDGDIVTIQIDRWDTQQRNVYNLYAGVLASSPDGRTLAAGDNEGGVSLFAFDTLRLMHRIAILDEIVTGIIFASNSLGFYDIRGESCNIWEPSVLVRKNSVDDNSSEFEEPVVPPRDIFITRPFDDTKAITVITSADDVHFVFCGREDGSVTVHDVNNGNKVLELQIHSVDIRHLEWHPRAKILLSSDTSGRCIATRLLAPPTDAWGRSSQVFEHRATAAVLQAMMRPDGRAILFSTQNGEDLWENNEFTGSRYSIGMARWALHPTDDAYLFLVDSNKVHLYRWDGLKRETRGPGVLFKLPSIVADSIPVNDWSYRLGTNLLVQMIQISARSGTAILMLDPSQIQSSSTEVSVLSTTRKFLGGVKTVLGFYSSSIFFLSRRGWICSLSIKTLSDPKFYTRHFFIPPFWQTGSEASIRIVSRNSVAFAYRDDLILFHRFLDINDKIFFDEVDEQEGPHHDFSLLPQ